MADTLQDRHEDNHAALHRVYIPSVGDPRKMIGWVSPTRNGWQGIVFKESFNLRRLGKGFVPRHRRTVYGASRAGTQQMVRKLFTRFSQPKEIMSTP